MMIYRYDHVLLYWYRHGNLSEYPVKPKRSFCVSFFHFFTATEHAVMEYNIHYLIPVAIITQTNTHSTLVTLSS